MAAHYLYNVLTLTIQFSTILGRVCDDPEGVEDMYGLQHGESPTICPGWESFIDSLGEDFSPESTDEVPTSIRRLFVAQATKADRALSNFRAELRRGETRQDDLMAELRVHCLEVFNAV